MNEVIQNQNLRQEYQARINRVVDYIESHLDEELTLRTLARVASFSPYHFHRIFGAMVGEPLNRFIQRLRLERAAMMLVAQRNEAITNIALDCGYSSSATFARAFRDHFGMSARDWRAGGHLQERKNSKTNGNNRMFIDKLRKDIEIIPPYFTGPARGLIWRLIMKTKTGTALETNVEVREMPEIHVAYVRHIGPYKGNAALFEGLMEKLMKWAGPRGLIKPNKTKVLAVYHDDPEITDEDKLRLSMCITVPADTEVGGEIGKMSISAGLYAIAHFQLATEEYPQAWSTVFGVWMPESGYQPADGVCYEHYLDEFNEEPKEKCTVNICVPVKPL